MLTLAIFRSRRACAPGSRTSWSTTSARGAAWPAHWSQAALDRPAEQGARTVDLTSRPDREAANRLYVRLGFELRADQRLPTDTQDSDR